MSHLGDSGRCQQGRISSSAGNEMASCRGRHPWNTSARIGAARKPIGYEILKSIPRLGLLRAWAASATEIKRKTCKKLAKKNYIIGYSYWSWKPRWKCRRKLPPEQPWRTRMQESGMQTRQRGRRPDKWMRRPGNSSCGPFYRGLNFTVHIIIILQFLFNWPVRYASKNQRSNYFSKSQCHLGHWPPKWIIAN